MGTRLALLRVLSGVMQRIKHSCFNRYWSKFSIEPYLSDSWNTSLCSHVQFSCIEIGKLLGFPSNLIFQIHQIHLCAHASHSRVWRGLEMRNKTIPLKWIHKRLNNTVLIINKMCDSLTLYDFNWKMRYLFTNRLIEKHQFYCCIKISD